MKFNRQQAAQKGYPMVSLLFILFTFLTTTAPKEIFAQSGEEAAIKKVLNDIQAAFFKRDAQTWQALWKHSPETSTIQSSSMAYNNNRGWEKILTSSEKAMKDNPEALAINIVQENFIFNVSGNLAIAEYDQTLSNFPDEPDTKFKSHRVAVLQKENNQWKLVKSISHIPETYGNTPEMIEARINETGYSLLASNKIDEAIELFALNVKFYPTAWNVYDSLGEAYALKGNKELAIKNYEKSVQINPKNDNGKQALTKLKQ
ncbi:MAG TPA: tetratricopeptide repeat protein [Daejeonella sp.]|nr:tetratricopeptide repeat protein [Daejeonella sp.]